MSTTNKGIINVVSLFILWIVYQLWLPPLSFSYLSGFGFISICIVTVIVNIAMWVFGGDDKKGNIVTAGFLATILLLIVFGIRILVGITPFNSGKMHQQLGEVEIVDFDDMIKQIDISQIPIVDDGLAKKQADKKIGEDIALGSRCDLGEVAIQEVNGEIVYVAPLNHSGFWKWRNNRSTPGYIVVSASNPNKVNYVTEINGEKIQVFYQSSAYFRNDLKRYIRNHGYRNVGLTEYTFEIDDTGRPYWVVTTFENQISWRCPEATGVVIVDAQTGQINWYAWNDVPSWVDIVQPEKFVEDQIDNWGKWVNGWPNWANKDKIEKTDLTLKVYSQGDCYYFTGMTSVGSDESCVGFIMVNTRNKKAYMSYMSGATEKAAMKSAEGLVSDFGYQSNEPLPLNVNGIPTYVMSLKDEEGLIKAYGMVNVNNYNIAVKGNTLMEVSRSYTQAIARSGGNYVVGSEEAYAYTYEGTVKRISSAVEDGSTYYYLVVDGEEDKIFTASYLISDELAITRDGDTVKISYIDDKNGTVDITSFDNVAFATPTSEAQQKRDEFDKGTSALDSEYNQIIQVNPELSQETWDNMTEEEKAKMLEEFMKSKDRK